MHDSTARLIGAREAANRLLFNDSGVPKSWPDKASAHRNALLELMQAVDEVMIVDRYPVNPDAPDEGTDLRATFIVGPGELALDPSLPPAEYHRRYQARFASR